MAEATLRHVLEGIRHLDPNEPQQVEHAIRELRAPASREAEREAALRVLESSGLVREVKRPPMVAHPTREPAPIQGKPLSQTIIEDRR